MADKTINQLPENTSPSATTVIELYDPTATPKSGKSFIVNFIKRALALVTGNTGDVLTRDVSGNPVWQAPAAPAVTGLANPSATVGLTPINGSATTAPRSDAAPALNVGISPVWTGSHNFRYSPVTVETDPASSGVTFNFRTLSNYLTSGFAGSGFDFRVKDTNGAEVSAARAYGFRNGSWDGTTPNRNGSFLVETLYQNAPVSALLINSGNFSFYRPDGEITCSLSAIGEATLTKHGAFSDGSYLFLQQRGNGASADNPVGTGGALGGLQWHPWDGAGYSGGLSLTGKATENFSNTAHGSKFHFETTPNGTTTTSPAVEIDNSTTAGDTRLLLWDVTAGSLVRVSRGAADSGGAGFRLLRVPN